MRGAEPDRYPPDAGTQLAAVQYFRAWTVLTLWDRRTAVRVRRNADEWQV
jgi:hypothetical protein